jgi:hypothetical protein
MEAQRIRIVLHDESAGYEVTPDRVPLSLLRTFAKDVDELLRGDSGELDTSELEVAVVKGSLGILTAPTANPGLLQDLQRLAASELIDAISARRRVVVERWQKAARGAKRLRFEIGAAFLSSSIVISADTDYRADDADQWVRVERYVRGEIEDMGGHKNVNAHIRLPDGKTLVVDADRNVLRDEKVNRLYKPAMVRISAEYNVVTREYRHARLLEFVEHDASIDEKGLERLLQRGAKAWQDVPDAGVWVDELRGNDA